MSLLEYPLNQIQQLNTRVQKHVNRDRLERFKQRFPRKYPFGQTTFCPRLWNDVFINDYGNVYPCCHMLPWSLGNLYETPLEEIWNAGLTRAARQMSTTRTLHCYDRCTLLSEEERSAEAGDHDSAWVSYDRLRRIKILFGELCNMACIMCNQDHRSKRMLSVELLEKQIDWTHLEDIEFQGGEPLAMIECKRAYVWLTEDLGKKVNFLTNGMLVNDKWAERICNGSTWLYFSINGVEPETFEMVNVGGKFHKIRRNFDRMLDARERTGSDINLYGHFTMTPENIHEAWRFPMLAKEWGFDRAEFGFDIGSVPKKLRQEPELKQMLQTKFAEVMVDPPVPVKTERLRILGLVE